MKAKTFILLCILITTGSLQGNGQPLDGMDASGSRRILLINNQRNQQIKELHAGDWVKLKLTDATKVKGIIMRIDTTSFVVSNRQVAFNQVMKISTKQSWVRGVGFGLLGIGTSLMWLGGMEDSVNQFYGFEDSTADLVLPGLIATGAGLVMVLPNYRDMGKHRFMVVEHPPQKTLAVGALSEN